MGDRPPIDPGRIRRRMRQLETVQDRSRSIAQAISETLQLSEPGDEIDAGVLASLQREIVRVLDQYAEHVGEFDQPYRAHASLGFRQGVMFACAIRDLLDAAERAHEYSGEAVGDVIDDAPPEIRRFLAGLDDKTRIWLRAQRR